MRLILITLSILMTLSSAAAETSPFVICKLKGSVRTIEVQQSDEGCKTVYSKSGVSARIGEGRFPKSCDNFVDNVRTNLEAADWKCRSARNQSVEMNSLSL